jgi:signal transduction histidine kinase
MRTAAGYVSEQRLGFDFPPVISASELGAFDVLRSMTVPRFFDPATEAHLFWPGTVEYHRRSGTKTIFCVSMLFGSRFSGFLGFAFREAVELSPERIQLVQALAQQATLVAELLRLAGKEQQAAIALEREASVRERAAQLAKANAALSRSVVQLTGEGDRPLLGGIIDVLRETLNAASVVVQICDRNILGAISVDHSRIETLAAQPGLADYLADLRPHFSSLAACRLSEDEKNTFRKQGVRGQLTVPLLLGEELLGALLIRLREDVQPGSEQVELAQSLAHQASLALRLTKLAAEARNEAVAKAASEERVALARELHDTLLQSFTGITLQLRALARRAPHKNGITTALTAIEHQATEAVQEARKSVTQMRVGQGIDLGAEIECFLRTEPHPPGIAVRFSERGKRRILPASTASDLLRLVQEGVRNAVRHSGASQIQVSLRFAREGIRIVVEDNGSGFELEQAIHKPGHFGLDGMHERARRAGAKLDIATSPSRGTSVLVELKHVELQPESLA